MAFYLFTDERYFDGGEGTLREMAATTIEKARTEALASLGDTVVEAKIVEAVRVEDVDVKGWQKARRDVAIKAEEEAEREKRRAEYERLRAEFGEK
jgi:hypothetical protein